MTSTTFLSASMLADVGATVVFVTQECTLVSNCNILRYLCKIITEIFARRTGCLSFRGIDI